jgi:hypothetical protein
MGFRTLRITSLAIIAACGGGDAAPSDDEPAIDAGNNTTDATAIDAGTPTPDGGDGDATDAASQGCQLGMTAVQACAIAWRGDVHACSIDAQTGTPSQNGWLDIARPDGTHGYLCATSWTSSGGYYFEERITLVDSSTACCGGTGATIAWPTVDAAYGTAHGPTHVKPWETTASPNGDLRENPFSIVVSNADAAAAFQTQRASWQAWAGDGQPHPAPDGSGTWWFRSPLSIQYVLVPTADGRPLIVIAPDVTPDAALQAPQGHPTLGACTGSGGAPLAYVGGEIHDATLSNRSGRFGHESTITQANLQAAADLFNCYGISITAIDYVPPT